MADENRILSAPPGGTGDNMYEIAGAIDPREVGVEALNAGALTDEEFMMAEEFMNALPEEAKESFIDRLINDPKATIMSIMDTLGDAFGGGSGQIMDDLRDRGALSGINSGLIKGAMTDGAPSLEQMQRDDMMRYDPPDLRRQEEILMRNMTER
mgnify:CR=1 FL=1